MLVSTYKKIGGGISNFMRCVLVSTVCVAAAIVSPGHGAVLYNNLFPNNLIAIATSPESPGKIEIEAGDDFLLNGPASITTAHFVGLIVPNAGITPTISEVVAEIYRVFPKDSNDPPSGNVPTRDNSPSDVAFDSRDSTASGELTFTTSVLNPVFVALNSIQPGGIHPKPGNVTMGNGPLTGQEVQFDVTFTAPFGLPADHYFFVPQVGVTGGQFYWLSSSRPISGPGSTPFAPDLQAWTRDANLDPDWLRVGTDIIGGATPPTFNTAFSLEGTVTPEPSGLILVVVGIGLISLRRLVR